MRPDPDARPAFVAAFRELTQQLQDAFASGPKRSLPIRMIVAGGTAIHLYTGARVTSDIDAVFSRRVALPAGLEATYLDADGAARWLRLDPNYNDTLTLMHEDAREDAVPLRLPGIDPKILDICLLTPTDLAVSKLARFGSIDRTDIETLARRGLIKARPVRQRAETALTGYVGDLTRVRTTINQVTRLIEDIEHRAKP